jgi:hypothetical protein
MAQKSLIVSMEIKMAGRAHDCRYNKKHHFEKGDSLLMVRSDGEEHHYCLACAKAFLTRDVERLRILLADVEKLIH